MEELQNSAVEVKAPAESRWYEGVGLEDAETYIRANLKSAARCVIAIGYYLKCVKEKGLFVEAGFKDIFEYAKDRFGFSSSTTSRYMTRNDKFSINGNSPLLDEKYKDFNKSQLQEMLSLDAEQLETVTPDMTVAQIREMKKPKAIPYVAIPGQVELADFPGVDPEDVAAAAQARGKVAASQPEKQTYTISAEDLLPDPEPQETEQSIAISQQEPEPAQSERTRKCIHRLDFECYLAEEHKHIPGNGKNCDRACCWDCTEHGKGCQLECYSSARRPETLEKSDMGQDCPPDIAGGPGQEQEARVEEQGAAEVQQKEVDAAKVQQDNLSAYGTPKMVYPEDSLIATAGCEGGHSCTCCHVACSIRQEDCYCVEAPMGNPFPCDTLKLVQALQDDVGGRCQFIDHRLAYHMAGDHEPVPCCKECKDPCDYMCGRAKRKREKETGEPQPDHGCRSREEEAIDESYNISDLPQAKEMYLRQLARVLVEKNGAQMVYGAGRAVVPSDEVIRKEIGDLDRAEGGSIYLVDGVAAYASEEIIEFFRGEEDLGVCTYARFATQARKALDEWAKGRKDKEPNKVQESKPDAAVIDGVFTEVKGPEGLTEPGPSEQPELPVLKNNDQHAAFIDNYESWPLWIETVQTGERYYRYDLEDGTSMVVKVYRAKIFDGFASGSYEAQYHDGYGRHEYYLLQPGKFFRDSETNRSLLIEKLKEIYKAKKG